jgi:hypothetical protein
LGLEVSKHEGMGAVNLQSNFKERRSGWLILDYRGVNFWFLRRI